MSDTNLQHVGTSYIISWNRKGLAKLKTKDVKDVMLRATRAMGLRWRRSHLPRYFTNEGFREFRYQPRAGQGATRSKFKRRRRRQYYERKRHEKGHTLPLVWSGELRRMAVYGPRLVKVTGTSHYQVARMPMPRKANWKNPDSKVHPIQELRSVSDRVMKDLHKFLVHEVDRQLKAFAQRK